MQFAELVLDHVKVADVPDVMVIGPTLAFARISQVGGIGVGVGVFVGRGVAVGVGVGALVGLGVGVLVGVGVGAPTENSLQGVQSEPGQRP